MKYCFNCGSKIIPNSKFCSECGSALNLPLQKEGFVEKPENLTNPDLSDIELQTFAFETNYTQDIPSSDIQGGHSDVESYLDKTDSSIWVFVRGVFVFLSFIFLYFAVAGIIGHLFFPYLIDSYGGLSAAAIFLPIGILVRYFTLRKFDVAVRFKIIMKNVSFVVFLYALQGYRLSVGVLLILISAAIVLYLDTNTPNGFFKEVINGQRPPKYFVKIAIFVFLVSTSIHGGRTSNFQNEGLKYNYNIENITEIQKSPDSQEVKVTVVDRRMEGGDADDPREKLAKMIAENEAYFGDSEKERVTVERVQEKLKQMGYYNGQVDGINGPITKKAVIAYKRDTYVEDEWGTTIDEYANEFISLTMLRELEIPIP